MDLDKHELMITRVWFEDAEVGHDTCHALAARHRPHDLHDWGWNVDRGSQLELDIGYDEVGGGKGWRMIIERGPYARLSLMRSLVRAYVAVRENPNGTWTYSIGKMSPFVPFPIEALYAALNLEEGIADGENGWGGSNTIGGSPREGGSRLSPAEVERVINEHLGD